MRPEDLQTVGAVEFPPGSPMAPLPAYLAVGECDAEGNATGEPTKKLIAVVKMSDEPAARPWIDASALPMATTPGVPGSPELVGDVKLDRLVTVAVWAMWQSCLWYEVPNSQVAVAAVDGRIVAIVAGMWPGGGRVVAPGQVLYDPDVEIELVPS